MQLNRLFAAAAVLRIGVCAATIESSSGSAIVAPSPRSTVLRGRCFFVMKDIVVSGGLKPALYESSERLLRTLELLHAFLKRIALHDSQHERREPIVVLRRVAGDRAHRGHVVVGQRAAGRV